MAERVRVPDPRPIPPAMPAAHSGRADVDHDRGLESSMSSNKDSSAGRSPEALVMIGWK